MAGALAIDDAGIPFRKVIRGASPLLSGVLQHRPEHAKESAGRLSTINRDAAGV